MKIEQAPEDYIENYYGEFYNDMGGKYSKESAFVLSYLNYVSGKSILNLGCGPQFFDYIKYFSKIPSEYIGIDINQSTFSFIDNSVNTSLAIAKQYAKENNVKTTLICGDALKQKKEFTNHFDSILGVWFFGTFKKEDLKILIKNVHSYLKVGGTLVNIGWFDNYLPEEERKNKLKYQFDKKTKISPDETIKIIEKEGFELVKKDIFEVLNKEDYGWGKIVACVFKIKK